MSSDPPPLVQPEHRTPTAVVAALAAAVLFLVADGRWVAVVAASVGAAATAAVLTRSRWLVLTVGGALVLAVGTALASIGAPEPVHAVAIAGGASVVWVAVVIGMAGRRRRDDAT